MSLNIPHADLVSDQEQESFIENGFLVKKNLLDSNEIETLKSEILDLARGKYPHHKLETLPKDVSDSEALKQILCLHQPHHLSPVIREYTQHPKIAGMLSRIVAAHLHPSCRDGSVKCMQSMFFVKAPGKPGQAWHQDEIYIPTRDRSLCGAWIAVDDATIDNGCLWVLPGSHKPGVLYQQKEHKNREFDFARESFGFDDSAEIAVEVPAGSVVFFNGYLLHRSRKNRSDIYRRALVSHYCSAQTLLPWMVTKEKEEEGWTPATLDNSKFCHLVSGENPYSDRPFFDEAEPKVDGVMLRRDRRD